MAGRVHWQHKVIHARLEGALLRRTIPGGSTMAGWHDTSPPLNRQIPGPGTDAKNLVSGEVFTEKIFRMCSGESNRVKRDPKSLAIGLRITPMNQSGQYGVCPAFPAGVWQSTPTLVAVRRRCPFWPDDPLLELAPPWQSLLPRERPQQQRSFHCRPGLTADCSAAISQEAIAGRIPRQIGRFSEKNRKTLRWGSRGFRYAAARTSLTNGMTRGRKSTRELATKCLNASSRRLPSGACSGRSRWDNEEPSLEYRQGRSRTTGLVCLLLARWIPWGEFVVARRLASWFFRRAIPSQQLCGLAAQDLELEPVGRPFAPSRPAGLQRHPIPRHQFRSSQQ